MQIIDGKVLAERILSELKSKPAPKKFLGAILVGNDSSSISFLEQKKKTAEKLGIDFRLYPFPENLTNDTLRAEVHKIADHKTCGGVIVQLPLPEGVNKDYVLNAIPREKDVDVLSERAIGAFYANRNPVSPPAVATFEEILKETKTDIKNLRIAVVGLGVLVGKPIAAWLMSRSREVMLLHRGSDFALLKNADVVILGTGSPGLIKGDMLKSGAGIIDFGYGEKEGKLMGDLDSESISPNEVSFYTPTPGGTGPILVAKLFQNFYTLNTD